MNPLDRLMDVLGDVCKFYGLLMGRLRDEDKTKSGGCWTLSRLADLDAAIDDATETLIQGLNGRYTYHPEIEGGDQREA